MISVPDPFDPASSSGERERLHKATDQLTGLGFVNAGWWVLDADRRGLRLRVQDGTANVGPALYAFTVDGALAYIGKTARPLRQRMQGYQSPGNNPDSGASTNRDNHARILQALSRNQSVRILVFTDVQVRHHGGFAIDLPAGLEGSLIDSLAPPWNRLRPGRSQVAPPRVAPDVEPPAQSGIIATPTPEKGRHVQSTALLRLNYLKSRQDTVQHALSQLTSPEVGQPLAPQKPAKPEHHPPVLQRATTRRKPSNTPPGATALNSSKGNAMQPTVAQLLDYARSKHGTMLHTLRNKTPFRVEVIGDGLAFLPSSGQPRREGQARIEAVLREFGKKNSWQMSDYRELTFNASYLLTLLKGWQVNSQS